MEVTWELSPGRRINRCGRPMQCKKLPGKDNVNSREPSKCVRNRERAEFGNAQYQFPISCYNNNSKFGVLK
jgi:hypothetical protein